MSWEFSLEGVRRTVFAQGASHDLAHEVALVGAAKALVVLDPGVASAGIAQPALHSLSEAGIETLVYSDITREPEPSEADAAAEMGKQLGAQAVVGIGGGSALDLAKAASVLITNPGQAVDYVGLDKVEKPGVPSICLPTTAGTGSEVTWTAVFTRRADKFKGGINDRYLYPHTALLDPLLTVSCPPYISAITGMDALTHAMEAYTSKKANPVSDMNALTAIELIGRNRRPAVANGSDLDAREGMLLASHLAGLALAQAGVTAVHAMAYPLGAFYDIPHGEANALLLPFVLRHNLEAAQDRFAMVAHVLADLPAELDVAASAQACVEQVVALSAEVGIPASLHDLEVPQDSVPAMAEKAMTVAVPIANNPCEVTAADLEAIYQKAFA
jgi:alcohol dehydrogenase